VAAVGAGARKGRSLTGAGASAGGSDLPGPCTHRVDGQRLYMIDDPWIEFAHIFGVKISDMIGLKKAAFNQECVNKLVLKAYNRR
jgi:hypothetical protein